ncbi:gluconate 2-dehydrogenase subunit 3 family protein [Thalassotalea sp. PS06]|uniref:gluconate 2-dehydrogenase subunit 3 family protein n=1 Tax=Thalassotalea sp. PS06 TaxID=2594005 RepID=UPI0011654CF1|nr:gluconate 2-dehydrogenase subunit 3 family protein [Thalassotalea sp. PS06]QDP00182.1 gluconate 2-dehydrogenase subunit 3 family protein [Thalassotalea sp. PS06]
MDLNRRQFLNGVTRALGAGAALIIVNGASLSSAFAYQRNVDNRKSKLLNRAQLQTLAQICQTIIPKTDTPGAADLDCHGFIDHQLQVVYGKSQQQAIVEVLGGVEEYCYGQYQLSFTQLQPLQQTECLQDLERGAWGEAQIQEQFAFLKSLNAFAYFTSEVGATQVLNYQAVPGGYQGSIPFTADTKNYGSRAFY